jgi:hypothetical protein
MFGRKAVKRFQAALAQKMQQVLSLPVWEIVVKCTTQWCIGGEEAQGVDRHSASG